MQIYLRVFILCSKKIQVKQFLIFYSTAKEIIIFISLDLFALSLLYIG